MSGFTEEWMKQRNREVLGIGVEPPAPATEDLPKDLRPEWMIQEECVKLLQEDGWRHLRTDPVSDRSRGAGFGEVGMADSLFIRYSTDPPIRSSFMQARAQVAWIEWKSANGKPKKHQILWHEKERARGALTLIAGIDFLASLEGFRQWYQQSGLMRRDKWW